MHFESYLLCLAFCFRMKKVLLYYVGPFCICTFGMDFESSHEANVLMSVYVLSAKKTTLFGSCVVSLISRLFSVESCILSPSFFFFWKINRRDSLSRYSRDEDGNFLYSILINCVLRMLYLFASMMIKLFLVLFCFTWTIVGFMFSLYCLLECSTE